MGCTSTDAELSLLRTIAPQLTSRLGPILIWVFSATFTSFGTWVVRMDYVREGDDPDVKMKSILLEGTNDRIEGSQPMRPRIFRERPSIIILRDGLIQLELEAPELGEREV